MPWLQIRFQADQSLVQPLLAALDDTGALSVTVCAADDELRLQAGVEETALWQRNEITAMYPEHIDVERVLSQLREQLHTEPPPPRVDLLADADWAAAWKAHYRPLAVGRNLWICPSWLAPPEPQAVNILLDPGMAFGTGDHPTTALCLEWLAEQALSERRVIDYGCGSGILAIAALKLGADQAIGVDIDPQALTVSRENASKNGVDARLALYAPETLPAATAADVVIANILARPLMELAPRLRSLVASGGTLVLTGLLREQADEVRAVYEPEFRFDQRRRGEWVMHVGTRPS